MSGTSRIIARMKALNAHFQTKIRELEAAAQSHQTQLTAEAQLAFDLARMEASIEAGPEGSPERLKQLHRVDVAFATLVEYDNTH